MSTVGLSQFDHVLTHLANRMVPPEWARVVSGEPESKRNKRQVVFLLGAGCSRQYGLPSFLELLVYFCEDLLSAVPKPPLVLEAIRERLEAPWQALSSEERHAILDHFLNNRVSGTNCPGYVHLARLAAKGYVKAFVNMNFDVLLEEALEGLGVAYTVSTSFLAESSDRVMVYKPHGTIGRLDAGKASDNQLILDIARSDLFSRPKDQEYARKLFLSHDVVSIGYSGVDAKIVDALRSQDERESVRKLFVFNISRSDPRLLLAMAERGSADLLLTGGDAAFENVIMHLMDRIEWREGGYGPVREKRQRSGLKERHLMSRAERSGLHNCLRLALEIRLSMNIAERSRTSIEEHGNKLFEECLHVARQAGICLSPAEKYLLHCAAYLHDLGYYRGYTRAKAGENPGWTLLCRHGALTKELLEKKIGERSDVTLARLIPDRYESSEVPFEKLLGTLCEGHTGLIEVKELIGNTSILIDGVRVPVRFPLLLSLLALAEDLAEGHPFLPSSDLVRAESQDSAGAIVDPVLDLYLRHNERPVEFAVERSRIRVTHRDARRPATTQWLLTMTAYHVHRFDRAARDAGGWGMKLVFPPESKISLEPSSDPLREFEDLLRLALLETLDETLPEISEGSSGEACALLDLVSIYTLSTGGREREEPRVRLDKSLRHPSGLLAPDALDRALHRALEVIKAEQYVPQEGLLQHYLPRKRRGFDQSNPLHRLFQDSFEKIIYPAWRFCARNWNDGIESVLMARACFDFGSTHLRSETLEGVRRLLEEKIEWDEKKEKAYGHDRCTLCTSRLLYILANARRFFPSSYSAPLDQTIRGILLYFLSLDPEDKIWWGLAPVHEERSQIRSADYPAWAARALGFCLSVDMELKARTGTLWLRNACGLDDGPVKKLLRQRWKGLFDASGFLDPLAEEPHSFIFGHMSLACLELQRYHPEIRRIVSDDLDAEMRLLANKLRIEVGKIGALSQLSRFYLWPLDLLLDSTGSADAAEDAVELCRMCVYSPVWIKKGGDAGSWGFNVKNTEAIVTSLVEFWRYVLSSDEQEARFEEVFRRLDGEAKGPPLNI